jgi:hypothetical protein
MGETSKKIGDLGEKLVESVLKKFGWNELVSPNFDFGCISPSHKTESGEKEKKFHGIDFVHSYNDPYNNRQQVLLIDSKAVGWLKPSKTSQNARKTAKSLASDLQKYLETIDQKIFCASLDSTFSKSAGLSGAFDTIGIIAYYVHDSPFDELFMQEILDEVKLENLKSRIFILTNSQLDLIYSLDKLLAQYKDFSFCYLKSERREPQTSELKVLSLETIFSDFFVIKAIKQGGSDEIENLVFYKGVYDTESIKSFASALARYQVPLLDHLFLYPVGIGNTLDNQHGIQQYFKDKELVFYSLPDKSINAQVRTFDLINVKFTIGGA